MLTIAITNFLIFIAAAIFIRPVITNTLTWHKIRYDRFVVVETDKSLNRMKGQSEPCPYKDLIPGEGEGSLRLGGKLELLTNLYSVLFVSAIMPEYQIEFSQEKIDNGDKDKSIETSA